MKDSVLRQDIMDELDFEPYVDANDIGVAVEDGIVTLSGYVRNYSQKLAVERAVSRVKGVRAIAQEIEVRYPGSAGTADDEIARRVANTLKWSALVPEEGIQVRVENGWVRLSGRVDWNYQKTGAADAIRDIEGVRGVDNFIELVPRPVSSDVKRRIQEALKRHAEVDADSIEVEVEGSKVILKGAVRALSERTAAEHAAWATPGVHAVEDRLLVI